MEKPHSAFAGSHTTLGSTQSDDDLYYDPVWDVQPEPVATSIVSTPSTSTYREELPEYDDEYDEYEHGEDQWLLLSFPDAPQSLSRI
ncbi:MAG: hypothetical protein IPJ06_13970 [Saprospiraceae bacterium]|nr:hypothetical protein [Saprospiraceae bacterium]